MSGTLMSEELKSILGITEGSSTPSDEVPGEGDEFSDYKDEPRAEVKFEMVEKETCVPDLQLSDAKTDYAYARSMNYTLLDMTTQALAKALAVANETEHPRAFESFNALATTARGLTQDLLALQKVFKEVTKGRSELDPPPPTQTLNLNVNTNTGTVDIMKVLQDSIDRGEIKPLMGNASEDDDE